MPFRLIVPVISPGLSPDSSNGSISDCLSMRANSSEAAVAARLKVTILGVTCMIVFAAMMTEKRTLTPSLVMECAMAARLREEGYLHKDGSQVGDLAAVDHGDALPESQAHAGVGDEILPPKHDTV